MSEELVGLTVEGRIGTVTLDAPSSRNALSVRLLSDLNRQLERALGDDRVRAIVLTGSGPVFCSGADLKEQLEASTTQKEAASPLMVAALKTLWGSPKPVIARVNGHARGGGIGLIAACDLSVAALGATFAFSEVRVGVAPAIISVVVLPRIGIGAGLELFLTGEPFDAARAERIGLVNHAVEPGALDATVRELADRICKGGPNALAAAKRLVRQVPTLPLDEAFAMTARLSAWLFDSDEAREGQAAFTAKRPPAWQRD